MDIKMTFTQTLDTNATHNETNKRWRLLAVTYFYFSFVLQKPQSYCNIKIDNTRETFIAADVSLE